MPASSDHDAPDLPAPKVAATTRHPSRRNEPRRYLLIAAAFAVGFLIWTRRNAPDAVPTAPNAAFATPPVRPSLPGKPFYPTPIPPPPARRTEHVARYKRQNETLVKTDEWWKRDTQSRQTLFRVADYAADATGPQTVVPEKRTVHQNNMAYLWDTAAAKEEHYYDYDAPASPFGWKDYSVSQITGGTPVPKTVITDGGTKTVGGRTIHTVFVSRTEPSERSVRYVCQLDKKTNLPVQVDTTEKRGTKWVVTSRHVFEWNRSLPDVLFDEQVLDLALPPRLVFPPTVPK